MSGGETSSLEPADGPHGVPAGDAEAELGRGGRSREHTDRIGPGKREIGLGVVLAVPRGDAGPWVSAKAPCAAGTWGDGRQYTLPVLHGHRSAARDRAAPRAAGSPTWMPAAPRPGECDEYPVLTMCHDARRGVVSPLTGSPPRSRGVLHGERRPARRSRRRDAWALYLMVGRRALYFALAPTLLIYAFMNWDLLAVALATARDARLPAQARRGGRACCSGSGRRRSSTRRCWSSRSSLGRSATSEPDRARSTRVGGRRARGSS